MGDGNSLQVHEANQHLRGSGKEDEVAVVSCPLCEQFARWAQIEGGNAGQHNAWPHQGLQLLRMLQHPHPPAHAHESAVSMLVHCGTMPVSPMRMSAGSLMSGQGAKHADSLTQDNVLSYEAL